jgi:hypothetical protein
MKLATHCYHHNKMLVVRRERAPGGEAEEEGKKGADWLVTVIVPTLVLVFPDDFGYDGQLQHKPRLSCFAINRERKCVQDVFNELGPGYTRRVLIRDPGLAESRYPVSAIQSYNVHAGQ